MRLLEIIPSGENWSNELDDRTQIENSLQGLRSRLQAEGLDWRDISLLWLANSREITGQSSAINEAQEAFDGLVLEVLAAVSEGQGAWPQLIGSTVKSSFFFSDEASNADITDGLLWVAFVHRLLPTAALGVEITGQGSSQRRDAGRQALERAALDLTSRLSTVIGQDVNLETASQGSLGLVFTSGSGHVAAAAGGVDFRDCYGVGQELLATAAQLGLTLTGGCASNRAPRQPQSLYFSSDGEGGERQFHATYEHGAIVAILPAAKALVQLDHPYKRASDERLTLDFHPHDQYSPGRYFYVRSINDRPPRDFLEEHWTEISLVEFQEMVTKGQPIPAKPRAHYFSIASSPDPNPRSLWPNIPVYFETVDQEVLLRLVRAESEDAYFYPVRMTPAGLVRNAADLRDSLEANGDNGDSLVTFLCESRKYVLEELGSNEEVETLASARPERGKVLGVYLNGEYSTGEERSIGYHNYSQIGVIFGESTSEELPEGWARMKAGL